MGYYLAGKDSKLPMLMNTPEVQPSTFWAPTTLSTLQISNLLNIMFVTVPFGNQARGDQVSEEGRQAQTSASWA